MHACMYVCMHASMHIGVYTTCFSRVECFEGVPAGGAVESDASDERCVCSGASIPFNLVMI